ncbi:hypothetical protein THAOC_30478 [Thalassiosira oceanica]|uniref:Hcy-binding domain-containing protein n=1 Tax=Thalassiosira oceanica TaxID=159749 RepID=K0RBC7_THAOC|nr:hypothetical protein THAOC_30478 [Thalassiosira oceanica]|eukprot:EJK50520.1 hypothetical protein THAOC_30478 [Thalassiosira oceanica]
MHAVSGDDTMPVTSQDDVPSAAGVVLLDGGMGHELKLQGISDGTFLSGLLANEDSMDAVESIHQRYIAAGCRTITTNNFVAVPQRMLDCQQATNKLDSEERARQLVRAAVERAKHAILKSGKDGVGVKIAGCVPPLTDCYFADLVLSLEEMIPSYEAIISELAGHVDVLLAETLSTSVEAEAILIAISKVTRKRKSASIPVWISFTINDDSTQTRLRSGEDLGLTVEGIVEKANNLEGMNLQAIGINCSTPTTLTAAIPVVKRSLQKQGRTTVQILAYGNCFKTTTSEWMKSIGSENEKTTIEHAACCNCDDDYEDGYLIPQAYAEHAMKWISLGCSIVGGCCGSRPEHMKAVSEAIQASTTRSEFL